MINKEKFKKLVDLAYELEKFGADVFLTYYGHVKKIEIEVYLKGWKMETDPDSDYHNECYFDGTKWGYKNETIDNCIYSLTEMINIEKESLDV